MSHVWSCGAAPEGGAGIVKDIQYLMIRLLNCMQALIGDKTREVSADNGMGTTGPGMDRVDGTNLDRDQECHYDTSK